MESGLDLFAMAAALTAEEDNGDYPVFDVDMQTALLEDIRARSTLLTSTSEALPVIEEPDVSVEVFEDRFHKQRQPVVLLGCFTETQLAQLSLPHLKHKFGRETFALYNGQAFTLTEYMSYCSGRAATDLAPLYIFEDLSLITSSQAKSVIIDFYKVPKYFRRNLFNLVQDKAAKRGRPRFRWLLIGPTRSGTPLHQDPHGTSAWNTLVSGSKYWVLLPPTTKKCMLRLDIKENLAWCKEVLPDLLADKSVGAIEYIQQPGETIFVPAGWWHAVINLELSVAVTENLAVACNATAVLRSFMQKKTWSAESRLFYAALIKVLKEGTAHGACVEFVPKSFECEEQDFKWGLWSRDDRLWLSELKRRYRRDHPRLVRASKGEGESLIPKRIHQIWLGPRPVPFQDVFIRTWKDLHRHEDGWEYKLWRDADAKAECAKSKLLKVAFDAASNFGEKSDILRYHILSEYGGVYVDIDFECFQPLDVIARSSFTFVSGFSNVKAVEINNGFIAATPSHPLLAKLMQGLKPCVRKDGISSLVASFLGDESKLVDHAMSGDDMMSTIERTGPGLFTRTLMSYILQSDDEGDVMVLPPMFLYPAQNWAKKGLRSFAREETLALHHWKKTWQQKD